MKGVGTNYKDSFNFCKKSTYGKNKVDRNTTIPLIHKQFELSATESMVFLVEIKHGCLLCCIAYVGEEIS